MGRAALFLDRDGVINVDRGYVHRVHEVEWVEGIFALARAASSCGLALVVVTNQSGIARGYYGEEEFATLMRWMAERFAAEAAPLAGVYHCPYHPTEGVGRWRRDSDDRKPAPGMLRRAARELDLALPASWLLGDRETDMAAGRAAGVGRLLLLNAAGPAVSAAEDVEVVGSLDEARRVIEAGCHAVAGMRPARAI